MRYILDTHVALWFFNEPEKLSKTALNIVRNQTIEKRVSIASAWELAIKIGIGKLMFEGGVSEFFRIVEKNGFGLLAITAEHVKRLETLPLHHRDPFDRIIIASAMTEKMSLISEDENIPLYEVAHTW